MSEDRLIDIESKLAHQEQLLNELNDVITEQQAPQNNARPKRKARPRSVMQ